MPRGPYDTTGVVKPGAPKPPKGKKCPQLVPGHTVIPSQHACFSDMRTVFAMMISTADRNKKGFVG
ncbi:hypothetical protein HYE67_000898 [Fusarium culmorum]|uniref:Chromosome 2, complete genome n=3 Tax=Fusarium sambucinum species complex TaxID=569360 RepID=A0A098DE47_GIBZE|nr:hypothetical protein FGRA07_08967 [Fusarium graminearum]QPC58667.1 hypothetical protein HYE67_000898 [Fusarium culmorum]CAF3431556.1 unnamed protein product [Fusarium graminearum]CAF3477298.1 unnamed protein product [Fusarium graminearum]CAG1982340.1 unnamed protein product [Fusarium graminearum]